MFIIEHLCPYRNKLLAKKIKGNSRRNAEDIAFSYAKKEYENFRVQVTYRGYETIGGKKTGKGFTFRGEDNFFMFTG